MGSSTIIYIVIGAFVIWVLFIREINPSKKTDEQLKWMHERAHRNFMRTLKPSKEFELINEEMERRGLFGNKSLDPKLLSEEEQNHLDEANKIFDESGMQEQMEQLFASGAHENMIHKVLEIAVIKNITQEEASQYMNELYGELYNKHKSSGLSDSEADQLAINEVIAMEINNT